MTPGTEELPTEMGALALRCEQATGPDRELDCAIGRAFGFRPDDPDSMQTSCPWAFSPSYTSSIDAAMTLVPGAERWSYNVTTASAYGSASVIPNHGGSYGVNDPFAGHGRAVSLPLAICAAALRARAHLHANPIPNSDSKEEGR